jgi:glucose/mannose-6-phosphate isomerase
MNHNEIVGWEVQTEIYPVTRVIIMEDPEQNERTSIRVGITARLVQMAGAAVRRVSADGERLLARTMSLIILGDYISVYLGAGWGVDPMPVEHIDYLKSNLAEAE